MEIQKILDSLDMEISPESLRELAQAILNFADSIDQEWNPALVRLNYPLFSKAARIERNLLLLSRAALLERNRARVREEILGSDDMGIPAWNMLLELFVQLAGGAKVSTKSLQIIAKCPETTALRIIDRLEAQGLVARSSSDGDRRVTFVTLTREGLTRVGTVLEQLSD